MERVTSRGLDRIMPAGERIYRIRRDYATRCSLIGSNGRRCKWLGIVMVSSNESIVVCSGTMRVAHYPVISVTIPRQDAIRASLDKHKRAARTTGKCAPILFAVVGVRAISGETEPQAKSQTGISDGNLLRAVASERLPVAIARS